MLMNPNILALLVSSSVVSMVLLLAATFSWQVVRHWNLRSGSEFQLALERRTYLISTLVAFAFFTELISLLLFVYTNENLSGQFSGAMCATGVLNVNPWGWYALALKILLFFAGVLWLILNRLDEQGWDYPLIRVKYLALMCLIPLVLATTVLQFLFFIGMEADVITSCCGALFSPEKQGAAAAMSAFNPRWSLILFYLSGAVTLILGLWALRRKAQTAFAISGLVAFVVALLAIISVIAPFIYEHPQHHCPFCLLKGGHDFVGYWLYIPLFSATALALGSGLISRFKGIESLSSALEIDSYRFTLVAVVMYAFFYLLATFLVWNSNLTMSGVWW